MLRSVSEFSIPTAVASSDFVAVVDSAKCSGCGDCLARCQFGALTVLESSLVCEVDEGCCVGCGLCTTVCPTEALYLVRRPEGAVSPPPADFREWMAQRAESRGLTEMP